MSQSTVHRVVSIDQVDDLRDAAHDGKGKLGEKLRDEALVTLSIDLGTRASETVALKRGMFDLERGEVTIPAGIQKDYPIENKSPSTATLELDPYGHFQTIRLLKSYFSSDWWQSQDGEYVFPTRQSEQMSRQTVNNIIERLAVRAGVEPRAISDEDVWTDEPDTLHAHAFRHSVANYMLADESTRLIDVRHRLRHSSILTTERTYEHFKRR